MACKLALGTPPPEAAEGENLAAEEVEALLEHPAFRSLVATHRRLVALPQEERLAVLMPLAWQAIERAILAGDVGAGLYVFRESREGRCPARGLVLAAMSCCRRRVVRPPVTAGGTCASPTTLADLLLGERDPVAIEARIIRRSTAGLRRELLDEHERRAVSPMPPPCEVASAKPPPVSSPLVRPPPAEPPPAKSPSGGPPTGPAPRASAVPAPARAPPIASD